MEINWFTVIAQVINFLILVWLLKRFLYKPVLNAIAEREKKIAAQLSDADAKKAEAQKERDAFQQKNEDFDKERMVQMNKVQEEASAEKQKLFEEARNESNALRAKYETSLKQQVDSITDMLKRKTQDEVFAITGKTLSDLAAVPFEEQLVKVFIQKIQNLKEEDKRIFAAALTNGDKTILVKSAADLSVSSKAALEKALWEINKKELKFQYQLAPDLVSGIEIDTGEYNLSWNIQSYLDTLQKSIAVTLSFKQNENGTV